MSPIPILPSHVVHLIALCDLSIGDAVRILGDAYATEMQDGKRVDGRAMENAKNGERVRVIVIPGGVWP